MTATKAPSPDETQDDARLRIQEVAADVGMTPRTIRYYEEVGLLKPGRSDAAYRLYDGEDVERLRFIKGLRDDAGFSLTEIGRLLEDEMSRARAKQRFHSTDDPQERRAILVEALERVDRQVATLRAKSARLGEMIDDATARRARLVQRLADLDTATPNGAER